MTRLTKFIKEQICKNAIDQSLVNKELKTANENLSKLALDVYNDNVTAEQIEAANRIQQEIEKLPFVERFHVERKWFHCVGYVESYFGGLCGLLQFPSGIYHPALKNRPTYEVDHEFSKRFLSLQNQFEKLTGQKNNLRLEIMAILNSCATLKKLQEIWPESINFLDGIQANVIKANLPTVVVEDLNKKLGITVS